MNIPKELRYTKTHEWARRAEGSGAVVADGSGAVVADGKIVVGISDYAQHEISDVVFIELPQIGRKVETAKPIAIVESVKAAFDIYAPVSGEVRAINTMLESDPAIVNADPYGKGWFFELTPANPKDFESLMTAEQYEHMIRQSASH